jgi:hypothetical protein
MSIKMGEAKRWQTFTKKRLAACPYCCFCGGESIATTLDHVPNIGLFHMRRRPKGLECSACDPCNQNTKYAEQVASFLTSIYPDASDPALLDEALGKFRKVRNHDPELINEIFDLSDNQRQNFDMERHLLPSNVSPLKANGPLLNSYLEIFNTKCVLALHHHLTRNIVPKTGVVIVRWHSNYENMLGRIPPSTMKIFSGPKTLEQGSFNVMDQFAYSSRTTVDKRASMHFLGFGQSFAVLGFVYCDPTEIPDIEPEKKLNPGFWNDKPSKREQN